MNVLFVYSLQEIELPEKPLKSPELLQFGISYISAFLKERGHRTRLIVLSRISGEKINRKIIDRRIKDFQPGLICFTAVSSEYQFISGIAKYIKTNYKGIYLLIGGVHVTLNPEEVLKDDFDALCRGEGEWPAMELANALERGLSTSGIPNLWIKNGGAIEKNAPRPFIEELDRLPELDREMWQEWVIDSPGSRQVVLLGRGCPFECAYCCNHALKKVSTGSYVRLRGVDNIVEEVRGVAECFPGAREIYLEVETFYLDKNWALELCGKLEGINRSLGNRLSFGVNLRVTPGADYGALFQACERANFKFINIGLESGSERIRKQVLRRNYSNQDIINAVSCARGHNLKVAFFNLVGVPGETKGDFSETVRLNRACSPDWVMTCIYYPYPGTDLYSLCREKGYLGGRIDTEMERSRPNLDLPGFSRRQVKQGYDWFYYDVYKGYRPISSIILRVLVNKLRAWPRLFRIYIKIRRNNCYNKIKLALNRLGA